MNFDLLKLHFLLQKYHSYKEYYRQNWNLEYTYFLKEEKM